MGFRSWFRNTFKRDPERAREEMPVVTLFESETLLSYERLPSKTIIRSEALGVIIVAKTECIGRFHIYPDTDAGSCDEEKENIHD